MARQIHIVTYDPQWSISFELERQQLLDKLPSRLVVDIEHIGSTAVKGLAAKPIIDLLMEVNDLPLIDGLSDAFTLLGYQAKGENGIAGRRYFYKGVDERSHHLHVFESGNKYLAEHIAFRDYLRTFTEARKAYQLLKQDAARACDHNAEKYMAYKNDFIQTHLKKALSWQESARLAHAK